MRTRVAIPLVLGLGLCVPACSTKPLAFVTDRWRDPVPVSERWTRVELETSGVSFELPDNYRTEGCCVLGRMATIHGEVVESPVYGLDVIKHRGGVPINAVEITVDVVTPWMMGADRGELAELAAAPTDPDVALWLYHRVFTPRLPNLKADKPATVEMGELQGVTFEAWRQHETKGPRDRSRVAVVSLSPEAAVVVQGWFRKDATDEHVRLYERIVESLRSRAPKVTI